MSVHFVVLVQSSPIKIAVVQEIHIYFTCMRSTGSAHSVRKTESADVSAFYGRIIANEVKRRSRSLDRRKK